MATIRIAGNSASFAATHRADRWWVAPAATAVGLIAFFGYLTVRAFNPTYVWYEPYISPTVAPPLFTSVSGYPGSVPVDHAWLGAFPCSTITTIPVLNSFCARSTPGSRWPSTAMTS